LILNKYKQSESKEFELKNFELIGETEIHLAEIGINQEIIKPLPLMLSVSFLRLQIHTAHHLILPPFIDEKGPLSQVEQVVPKSLYFFWQSIPSKPKRMFARSQVYSL
jgi:hypothetical protein